MNQEMGIKIGLRLLCVVILVAILGVAVRPLFGRLAGLRPQYTLIPITAPTADDIAVIQAVSKGAYTSESNLRQMRGLDRVKRPVRRYFVLDTLMLAGEDRYELSMNDGWSPTAVRSLRLRNLCATRLPATVALSGYQGILGGGGVAQAVAVAGKMRQDYYIRSVSLPVYSLDGADAVVYTSDTCGPMLQSSGLYHMHKVNGAWGLAKDGPPVSVTSPCF